MCTTWRLQTKTGSTPDKEQHIGDYCYNKGLIAMGWNLKDLSTAQSDRESIQGNFDKYLEYARAYSGKGISSVRRLKENVKENDLVWMRIRGLYYIGRIDKGSSWFFNASVEATEYDAGNQRDKVEWYLAGDEGDVPGVIITAFIQGTAFQRINSEAAKLFSCALFNKLSRKDHYTNLRHNIMMDTFYDYLSPSDAEDLLCFWLYQKDGYIVIPSTNKLSTQLYECVLLDTSNGKKAYIQVKKGSEQIDVQNYIELSLQGEVWLHATISDRKLRRPPGRKLLAYRIDREPLPPCKVRVKGQPLRGGLTRQAGWHGGHSQSIPAAISYKHQHTTGGRPCLIYAGSMTRISRKML